MTDPEEAALKNVTEEPKEEGAAASQEVLTEEQPKQEETVTEPSAEVSATEVPAANTGNDEVAATETVADEATAGETVADDAAVNEAAVGETVSESITPTIKDDKPVADEGNADVPEKPVDEPAAAVADEAKPVAEEPEAAKPDVENKPEVTEERQEGEATVQGEEPQDELKEKEVDTSVAPDAPPPTTPADNKRPDADPEGTLAITEKLQTDQEESTEQADNLVPQEIPSATVKFVLLPTAQVATMKCALNQTLRELKEHFALELKIPADVILLLHQDANVGDEKTLSDLGVGPNGTVQLDMQSADPINTPIKAFKPRLEYVMPDVITVRVETEPKRYKDIVVEVERSTQKKPFLGGYRHKDTAVEFHHASAQTGSKVRGTSNVERYCRDTQTYQMKHLRQQTSEDTSTQMTKIGVFVSNMSDKLLVPGKYTTAEQHHRMILRKVVILQKYWRRWLALRYVTKLKVDRQRRLDWEKQEEIKKREEKELRIKKEFERRMNPKTKEDFDLLYAALEKWRLEEMDKIDQTLGGAERKAALCQLLDQETQLIGSIGRHKKDADGENREKIVQLFLNKAASPKKWRGPDGCFTEMDTPYTIRAQELRDIYNSICMKYLTQDERLDVLLTLKHTVKEHDCKLTQEIIELIDREADLLMRGVKDGNLEGLRKRIATMFLQYIKTPTFNPEVARLLKVPQDPSTLRKNIYFCAGCNQYLPSVEFQLSTNSRTVGRCRKCRHLDNDARTRQDYSHYRLMLRDLRRVEESYGDDSKVAFLLQENDLRYLVEKIWNSQSIVSAWDDLYDLILVRWDKHKEWSPWNCVLLTKEESSAHERLETLTEGYGKELIHKIHRKHALARNYFSRLPGMSEHMRKRVTEPNDGPAVEVISVN